MAHTVEEMIAMSVSALMERDVEAAKQVLERDHLVNRHEVELDEQCLVILAKWQPMASDLRFITLCMKMVTDLERIGDLAVNISERAIDLGKQPAPQPWDDVPEMASLAQGMLRDAIAAFVEGDAKKAETVIERDRAVDELYGKVFRDLLSIMRSDPASLERGIHVQSVAKWLERMGDHCTNLAEQVIFMVRGKDIRHLGKLPTS
jgi:phosphate transport system protein